MSSAVDEVYQAWFHLQLAQRVAGLVAAGYEVDIDVDLARYQVSHGGQMVARGDSGLHTGAVAHMVLMHSAIQACLLHAAIMPQSLCDSGDSNTTTLELAIDGYTFSLQCPRTHPEYKVVCDSVRHDPHVEALNVVSPDYSRTAILGM